MNRVTQGGIAAAIVLAADQASKYWVLNVLDLPAIGSVDVLPVFSLTMVRNSGVTFGLLSGLGDAGTWVLAAVALAVVVALFVWMRRAESGVVAVALGAVAGGAVGNVIDRIRFGWVVDFLHAHSPGHDHVFGWSWYVFNVADAAIVCGVAALVIDSFRRKPTPMLADKSGQR